MAVDTTELRFSTQGDTDVIDITAEVQRVVEEVGALLNHDSNSHAHQRATLVGPSEAIPVLDGRLALGTWQQLVLIDFDDRPRERTVVVQITS